VGKPKKKAARAARSDSSSSDEGVLDPTPKSSAPIKNDEVERQDAQLPRNKKTAPAKKKVPKTAAKNFTKKNVAREPKGNRGKSKKNAAKMAGSDGDSDEEEDRTTSKRYPLFVIYFKPGLWIRIRIGSGFSDFVDPNPYWESGSRIRIQGQEN
jgi:hypothetical protein